MRPSRLLCLLLAGLLMVGCRVVEDKIELPAEEVEQPVVTAAEPPLEPASEAEPAAGEPEAEPAPEPESILETAAVTGEVLEATRGALGAALRRLERAGRIAAARHEQEELQRRRAAYANAAKQHLLRASARLTEKAGEAAAVELALVGRSLFGVRANLGRGLVVDELSFALAALPELQPASRTVESLAAETLVHLKNAAAALPEPGDKTDATADEAWLAAEISELLDILSSREPERARARLQTLVLELDGGPASLLVTLAETVRASVADAVAAKAWSRATAGCDRLGRLLDELITTIGQPPAPAARTTAPEPESEPAAEPTETEVPAEEPSAGEAGEVAPEGEAPAEPTAAPAEAEPVPAPKPSAAPPTTRTAPARPPASGTRPAPTANPAPSRPGPTRPAPTTSPAPSRPAKPSTEEGHP